MRRKRISYAKQFESNFLVGIVGSTRSNGIGDDGGGGSCRIVLTSRANFFQRQQEKKTQTTHTFRQIIMWT